MQKPYMVVFAYGKFEESMESNTMNIKQAKEHIKNSVKVYLKKDEYGAE